MTTDELLPAMANRPLCLSCLTGLTAAFERDALIALFSCNIESTVGMCMACKRDARTTYRFRLESTATAEV